MISLPELKGPKNRIIDVNFEGGNVTSDGGILLLKEVEAACGLLKNAAKCFDDPRSPKKVVHSIESMLRQRVFGLCLGYEDLNDHENLRHDIAHQTAAGRDEVLASVSTLCRLEQLASTKLAWDLHEVMVSQFICSFREPPGQIILDFDATDDRVYGNQKGRAFNGYYDHYIFLPLHVYCGDHLLVSYLRPGASDGALHAGAVLKLLVRRIRKDWTDTEIVFRADGGFARHHIFGWCERNSVSYIVGMPKNSRLNKMSDRFAQEAERAFERSGEKIRVLNSFFYAAGTWKKRRKIIVRAEHGDQGSDCRFVVTNIKGASKWLYEELYCMRGESENRIKETKLTLFSDRTSCVDWDSNQLRVLLSSLAHNIMVRFRQTALREPHPEVSLTPLQRPRMSFESIRLKLLKIGGVLIRNTRRIAFKLSSSCPNQELFSLCLQRLTT